MNVGLHTLIAEDTDGLRRAQPVVDGKVKTRRIFKGEGVTMIRLTIDSGAVLSEHVASVPIVLQSISGDAVITVGGEQIELSAGSIVHVDAHVPHEVEGRTPSHLLLLLLERAQPEDPPPQDDLTGALMSDVVLTSNAAESVALEAVSNRHAELTGTLAGYAAQLVDAASAGDEARAGDARHALTAWCEGPLTDLLDAEKAAFDSAALDSALAAQVSSDRAVVGDAIGRVAKSESPVDAAAAATAVRVQLSRHLGTLEDRLLPELAQSADVSLANLWAEVTAKAPAHSHTDDSHTEPTHVCECGVVDQPELPELDVRTVPHAIRHATVFGALDAVGAGAGLILIAPHDPLPLLAQIEQRTPGRFEVSYLERGPQAWRLELSNTGPNAG